MIYPQFILRHPPEAAIDRYAVLKVNDNIFKAERNRFHNGANIRLLWFNVKPLMVWHGRFVRWPLKKSRALKTVGADGQYPLLPSWFETVIPSGRTPPDTIYNRTDTCPASKRVNRSWLPCTVPKFSSLSFSVNKSCTKLVPIMRPFFRRTTPFRLFQ